ncbi:MAG: hypothetical protein IJV01_02215 [Bacteroidales bacterium]|nr:hypothetical protein [Bacteroidales bacterium]
MKGKTQRLAAIRALVSQHAVSSQEELLQKLSTAGFSATQATLSRDLKELGVSKTRDVEGRYVYRFPESNSVPAHGALGRDGIRSLAFGNEIAVIKTYAGFAAAVALVIDSRIREGVLGTIAGDDTVLVALEPGYRKEELIVALEERFPGIDAKII